MRNRGLRRSVEQGRHWRFLAAAVATTSNESVSTTLSEPIRNLLPAHHHLGEACTVPAAVGHHQTTPSRCRKQRSASRRNPASSRYGTDGETSDNQQRTAEAGNTGCQQPVGFRLGSKPSRSASSWSSHGRISSWNAVSALISAKEWPWPNSGSTCRPASPSRIAPSQTGSRQVFSSRPEERIFPTRCARPREFCRASMNRRCSS